MRILGKLPLLVALVGCGHPGRTTWEQDRRDGLGPTGQRRPRPALPPAEKKAVTIRSKTDPESTDYEELSRNLELEILRFTSARKSLARDLPKQTGWPAPMTKLWTKTLDRLEKGYTVPPGSLVRRLLIQTRVSLEVELDLTERRFGPAPKSLELHVGKIYALVAMHLRARPARDPRPRPHHAIQLAWPLSPVIVTSPYGYRRDPILGEDTIRFHAGVDLGASRGDVVMAAAEGRVTYAGRLGGHGRTVVVQHHGGYVSMYAHLRNILVSFGDHVRPGASIGLVGSSGRSTGPHLHFEVRHGGTPIDPLDVVGTVIAAR